MTARPPRNEELGHGESAPSALYMVRVVRNAAVAPSITGSVERFGTGDQRSFASGQELLDLIRSWPPAVPTPGVGPQRLSTR